MQAFRFNEYFFENASRKTNLEFKTRDLQHAAAFELMDIISGLNKVIVSSSPEAIISIDNNGYIMTMNDKARAIFNIGDENIAGAPLRNLLNREDNSLFFAAIEKQKTFQCLEFRIRTLQDERDYLITCSSISLSRGYVIGRLLNFSEIKSDASSFVVPAASRANFTFKDICGRNKGFKVLMDQAGKISQKISNVLLLGESGTGKDTLAQAIHNASPVSNGPYTAINCAALSHNFNAGELFGYLKDTWRRSQCGGTIFLNEIAETPPDIQIMLMRLMADKDVASVGHSAISKANIRIISATTHDFLTRVDNGNFRKALYNFLNIFNIRIPPLRERMDDIPLLMEHFIHQFSTAQNKIIRKTDERVTEAFMNYSWPGNVRELQNFVERMVNYAVSDTLTVGLIPPEIFNSQAQRKRSSAFESSSEKEKDVIRHMLALNHSKVNIAQQLNISRTSLYRKMDQYGLS